LVVALEIQGLAALVVLRPLLLDLALAEIDGLAVVDLESRDLAADVAGVRLSRRGGCGLRGAGRSGLRGASRSGLRGGAAVRAEHGDHDRERGAGGHFLGGALSLLKGLPLSSPPVLFGGLRPSPPVLSPGCVAFGGGGGGLTTFLSLSV